MARDLKWELENTPEGKSFRSYLGPRAKPTEYFGDILGPLGTQFGLDIRVNVWEKKKIEHMDLLFLIGADVLCGGCGGQKTCLNSTRVLGAGPREIELMVGS